MQVGASNSMVRSRRQRIRSQSRLFRLKLAAGARLEAALQPERLPMSMELVTSGVVGLLFGVVVAWLALRSRQATLSTRLSLIDAELIAAPPRAGPGASGRKR